MTVTVTVSMTDGKVLAGYILQERIAVGGMAEIYRAIRPGTEGFDKQVAIKTVLPDLGRDPAFVRMFLQEARLAARLSSPNLVQVFDAGQEGETYFLVMEYVDGVDLAALLQRHGPLPPQVCIYLGRQLCAALGDLHGAVDADGTSLGVVHRDVSPGNVLLSRSGDVKLGDYGIAKFQARGTRTERGTLKGKLAYLSPEQARGEEVDERTDLYGLGLVLFEALTGERYLAAQGEIELLREAEQPLFRPLTALRPGLPAKVDDLLARVLNAEAVRRYPSARHLDRALSELEHGQNPAEMREEIAALVRIARGDGERSQALVDHPPRDHVPSGPRPGEARPSTEVLDVEGAEQRERSAGRLVWAGALGAGLVAAVVTGVWLLGSPSKQTTVPSDAAVAVAPLAPPRHDASAAHQADARMRWRAAGRADAAVDVLRDRVDLRRRVHPRRARRDRDSIARVVAPVDHGAPPRPDASNSANATVAAAHARLTRLERLLEKRGLRRPDAPQIFARRDQLAAAIGRGEEVETEIERLEARIKSFVIDRAFVDSKLQRLNRKISRLSLSEKLKRRLQHHGQKALSYAVTGRYERANSELNKIARLIDR